MHAPGDEKGKCAGLGSEPFSYNSNYISLALTFDESGRDLSSREVRACSGVLLVCLCPSIGREKKIPPAYPQGVRDFDWIRGCYCDAIILQEEISRRLVN